MLIPRSGSSGGSGGGSGGGTVTASDININIKGLMINPTALGDNLREYTNTIKFSNGSKQQLVYDSSTDINLQNKTIINSSIFIKNLSANLLNFTIYKDGFKFFSGILNSNDATLIDLLNANNIQVYADGNGELEYRAIIK